MRHAAEGDAFAIRELEHPGEPGVAEVPLLLPVGQVAALEGEAHRLGLTAAQVLRGLVREFLRQRQGR